MDRRSFALGLLGTSALAGPAWAQPLSKPARILVGFPPGGSADLVARALAQHLTGYASSVLVDNKPGAGGRIAIEALKASEPDGSTLLVTPGSMMVVYPHIYRKLSYDPLRDVVPVAMVASAQFVIAVGPMVPAQVTTLAQFIDWCRKHPSQATYGSSGAGSIPHFTGVALGKATRLDWMHVAYKGAAPAMNDLLGGQVAANVGVLSNTLPHVQSGKLRALAVSGPARSALLPQVPTLAELGHADAQATEWFGVFLPAKASAETVHTLRQSVREALKARGLVEALAKASFEPAHPEGAADLGSLLRHDLARWGDVVKLSGFTPED
ncbi:MAG: tripartite tricarboxylate transporter substrate-binding protein [Burkholderiaceae bacterium]|nr:tripartite tricarboxylate transporter substrate-binding protein [Burkholderiaceae bacterium]